ncbi:hypothetical protein DSO57_1010109 [Entomophthora muscae]|uniref:Uncharacterized protein n=1 Tax=Entomophthora muscae TaxID=34485 RepID=A0ACC2U531_9FUNG|nr:hypothetical protein DSO57_1010109 [Entomophthora muscae]
MPCLCDYAKAWLMKAQDDSETSNWIISHTKVCPKCKAPIEKNGGCNRIVCGKCHFEFCWICMKSWLVHGYKGGCNAFKEVIGDKVLKSRANLEKYLHYHTRYANHIRSSKLDQKLYARTEENMEELQRTSSLSWIEVQFLKEAFNTLVKCRSILKWTYAFAYYLKGGNQKALFEDNQRDFEFATEALSGLLEENFEPKGLSQLKQNIQDKAKYVSQRREILLTLILQGYKDSIWGYTVNL